MIRLVKTKKPTITFQMSQKIYEEEYKTIFHKVPSAILIIDTDAPTYTIRDVNDAYLSATHSTREALVGHSVFNAFPANPTDQMSKNIERTIDSFQEAIRTGKPHTMNNYRYDIPIRGTDQFEKRYWTTTNIPIADEAGNIKYLIHSPIDVTELHRLAERERSGAKALKNQREQLYTFIMQAPVGIGIFQGPEYIVKLINPQLCELYGKSMDEMIDKPIFEVLPHARGQGYEELLDKVRLTGEPYQGQEIAVPTLKNGQITTVYVNFVYEPFRNEEGQITGIIVVATDVTDQVVAKIQLEEAEERARLAVDAIGLGTFDANLATGETITSPLFARIFGFDHPVSWQEYTQVIHPADKPVRLRAMKEAIQSGKLFYEARLIGPNQEIRWARIEGKVYFTGGKATRILGTTLDITEHKQAKEEQQKLTQMIADSEQLLKNITSATPTGLWTSDEQGNVTYVNQTLIAWTGKPFEEHLKDGWLNCIIEEDRQSTSKKFFNDLANRHDHEAEFRLKHTDGGLHWCVATGRPQYTRDGQFSGYVGSLVDITDLKHLQQQKDDFIGIASHELKTPVTSIKAYTQVLERLLEQHGDTKETAMIRKMDAQIDRLTSLIGDLLDVTKITTGKLQFNDRHFDFNTMVEEVIDDLQPITNRHKLIKNFAPTGVVYGDQERIGQVVTNLVTNALKYSPGADQVVISTELSEGEAILSVQDFGIGISPKNIDRVFEQFYRVSGSKQHTFPGLGLGLFISSEIIKREGGRIWVHSVEGEGSIFYFSLPVSDQTTTIPRQSG